MHGLHPKTLYRRPCTAYLGYLPTYLAKGAPPAPSQRGPPRPLGNDSDPPHLACATAAPRPLHDHEGAGAPAGAVTGGEVVGSTEDARHGAGLQGGGGAGEDRP